MNGKDNNNFLIYKKKIKKMEGIDLFLICNREKDADEYLKINNLIDPATNKEYKELPKHCSMGECTGNIRCSETQRNVFCLGFVKCKFDSRPRKIPESILCKIINPPHINKTLLCCK